ncbi:helix-turn-helix domain-containing protein [Flagellimonas pacifica]|uniref:Helix-turn-helix domain-containing protein n=1 Tax=Flagellimonas pacifica TaxID=1247520 RepID=A0A285MCT0_9FLAO|nr:helix-turn-helix domain-containing protein [Allomuricauda parva]SNY94985.1 Helix-turn-helix domain-containing protein [Allomuricauda parva]
MNYQTYQPHPDLESLVSCYWSLEVPASDNPQQQRIIPDGKIEMVFIFGDDIKRYTTDNNFILQPRAFVLGQILEPFCVEPTGYVNSFSISFYPFGFANFMEEPIKILANKETPIEKLFGKDVAEKLEHEMVWAKDTQVRIAIAEKFLLNRLSEASTVDSIVKSTVETLLATKGNTSISNIVKDDPSKRRQLERKFSKQIGISPKQLGKVIRLQSALKMLLSEEGDNLTKIAYKSEYYDQAHFIKDFREFTGISPKEFLGHENMELSSAFYK